MPRTANANSHPPAGCRQVRLASLLQMAMAMLIGCVTLRVTTQWSAVSAEDWTATSQKMHITGVHNVTSTVHDHNATLLILKDETLPINAMHLPSIETSHYHAARDELSHADLDQHEHPLQHAQNEYDGTAAPAAAPRSDPDTAIPSIYPAAAPPVVVLANSTAPDTTTTTASPVTDEPVDPLMPLPLGIMGDGMHPRRYIAEDLGAALQFVDIFDRANIGPLYILLMSDRDADDNYWSADCQNVHEPVMQAFEVAPASTRLLEVRVGAPRDWFNIYNPYRQHSLFNVNTIPALFKYGGNRQSAQVLLNRLLLDDLLLYRFLQVTTAPSDGDEASAPTIRVVEDIDAFEQEMDAVDNRYDFFVYFIAGRDMDTNRLWCRECDRTEVLVDIYFETYAMSPAVLLKVEVAPTYMDWQMSTNPFRESGSLVEVPGIPYLVYVHRDFMTKELVFTPYHPLFSLEDTQHLSEYFSDPLSFVVNHNVSTVNDVNTKALAT